MVTTNFRHAAQACRLKNCWQRAWRGQFSQAKPLSAKTETYNGQISAWALFQRAEH